MLWEKVPQNDHFRPLFFFSGWVGLGLVGEFVGFIKIFMCCPAQQDFGQNRNTLRSILLREFRAAGMLSLNFQRMSSRKNNALTGNVKNVLVLIYWSLVRV